MQDIKKQDIQEIVYKKETELGKIQVIDADYEGEPILFLIVNGQMESAMFLDKAKELDLIFPYMQKFSYAFAIKPDIRHTYLIGGGAFSYPKYYLDRYRKAKITVSEMSEEIVDLAYRFFRLDELDMEERANLSVVKEDGFAWLAKTKEKFDLIINDAFIGNAMQGRDDENTSLVAEHLQEDGIYMINMVSARFGFHALNRFAYQRVLHKYFANIKVIVCEEDILPWEKQNILVVASNKELL